MPDSSITSSSLGDFDASSLNVPVATVLSPTLTIHFVPSYSTLAIGPVVGGLCSSKTAFPSSTMDTVTHSPCRLARSFGGGGAASPPDDNSTAATTVNKVAF